MAAVREIPQSKLASNDLRGIAIKNYNGVMFVCSHQIIKATLDGKVIASVGTNLQFALPMGLCLTGKRRSLVSG